MNPLPDHVNLAPEDILLHTARLCIRPLFVGDYHIWREAWSALGAPKSPWDLQVQSAHDLTPGAFETYVQSTHKLLRTDTNYFLAIFNDAEDQFLGTISLMDLSRGRFQNAYLGYGILHTHWRQGYAIEACERMLAFAFNTLKLHRVEAGIEPDNLPSNALAQKLGLRHESLSPRRLFVRDQWRDMNLYALTMEEYHSH